MSKDFQHDDPDNWKWGVFYVNKRDHRFVVPKRNPIMGWTLNFAHPFAYILLGLLLELVLYQLLK